MSKKSKFKRFLAYIENRASRKEETNEINELAELYHGIDQIEVPKPSDSMKAKFYIQLENLKSEGEYNIHSNSFIPSVQKSGFLKLVAAILLIVGGGFLGFIINSNIHMKKQLAEINTEIEHLKNNTTIAVLSEQTASVKLEAIYNAVKTKEVDTDLVNALYNSMVSDENSNVRLAAAQALTKYLPNEDVKSMFIESLEWQDDPIVQISIINILSNIKQAEAIKAIQSFINKANIDTEIKNYAREMIYNTSI